MRFIFALVVIAFGPTALAATTEVFFSPAANAKERLITAIHAAKNSLDIASFRFTSVDIAEALLEAKGRGVHVRLLADENESQTHPSVTTYLQEEGLDVRYIKGRFGGRMHHSFVIFDAKAVFTGPYHLTEYSDKFNLANAILTDEPQLVDKYQAQFNKLYEEPLTIASTPTKQTTAAERVPRRFIGLSISHLDRLLGKDSTLPDSDKEILWSHSKNHYVRGEGEIISSSTDPLTGPTVIIRDKRGTETEILLDTDEADKVPKTRTLNGDTVSFTGRLLARPGAMHNYFKLDRGTLN